MREEARMWATSERDSMSAVIRHEYQDDLKACASAYSAVCHMRREHERHAIFVECEVEDRLRALETEAGRRHEKALAQNMRKAETVHAEVVATFRADLEAAAYRSNTLKMQAADLDKRRSAMGARVLELTKAENSLAARPQTLQVHHDDFVDHRNRQNITREQAAEEMVARLQKVSRLRSASSARRNPSRSPPKRACDRYKGQLEWRIEEDLHGDTIQHLHRSPQCTMSKLIA